MWFKIWYNRTVEKCSYIHEWIWEKDGGYFLSERTVMPMCNSSKSDGKEVTIF